MGRCRFVDELHRLRKSSSESIDNIEKFDSFKKYMHVTRTVEDDLKGVLRKTNELGKKTLILVCGSAGDGKSHLLSYLKNSDDEQLINNYYIHNDATESNSPSMTAIQTLNVILDGFKDCNLNKPGKNIILAINLGVLSNFIESEFGKEFNKLREYVEKNNILTTQINKNEFDEQSCFQHISFADYHMYSLTEEGIHAGYIEKIMKKIFDKTDENIFFLAYKSNCFDCPLSQKCPVKMNYEYLMDCKRQKYIAELLIMSVIQDKMILTTREVLNFVYDILVHPNFSYTEFQKLLVNDEKYLKEFMKQITPALIFDSVDVSSLMNRLQKFDPLLSRSEKADLEAISYYVSSDVSSQITEIFKTTSYKEIMCNLGNILKINNNRLLKSNLFNLIVRVRHIDTNDTKNNVYKNYIKDLFMFNAGKSKKLGTLYSMIEKSVIQWCGNDEDGNICLYGKNPNYCIYEKVKFKENIDHLPDETDLNELQRFVPQLVVAFENLEGKQILLEIDYSLYELIYKLNQGYIQTADDRNNHADFVTFVNRILQTGSLSESISIFSTDGKKASMFKSMFGYNFKVVR